MTGIPVAKLEEEESAKLLRMEEELAAGHRRAGEAVDGDRQGDPAQPRRAARSAPADRLLHLPRARPAWARPSWPACWPASSSSDPDALIRIDMCEYMEKFAVSRLVGRPAGLRRLRGGRPAHREGAAQALLGGAARRDREGAPGRLQHPAAGPGGRAADRQPEAQGQLQEHRPHHDQQHRRAAACAAAARSASSRRQRGRDLRPDEADGHGGGAEGLQSGVPEPPRRDHRLPLPRRARTWSRSSTS